jgi:solute:Na+ symporter, SSS family
VYLLRWYWWRINAWSEIAAMATALGASAAIHLWTPFDGAEAVVFAKGALSTTLATTVVWVIVTMATPPEREETLVAFYRRVRPDARGWRPIAALAAEIPETRDLGKNLVLWVLGCAMVYCAMFGIGEVCFGAWIYGGGLLGAALLCGWLLLVQINDETKNGAFGVATERSDAPSAGA